MPPLVSIVIPCYRGAEFLPKAIESCLAQSHPELEVLVVDDASPDDCAAIAERYAAKDARVRLIRRAANGGVAAAFNTGFNAAKGDYFTRLAQDDWFREDAVEIMLRTFAAHPQAGLVYCNMHATTDTGEIVCCFVQRAPPDAVRHGNGVGLCVMWRRGVWVAVGCFDGSYDTAEDYDYWCRVAEKFPLAHCREAPLIVRYHTDMGSFQRRARQELATARVRARYARTPAEARACFAEAHYLAGHACRTVGAFGPALAHFLKAIGHTPLAGKCWRGLLGALLRRGAMERPYG